MTVINSVVADVCWLYNNYSKIVNGEADTAICCHDNHDEFTGCNNISKDSKMINLMVMM